MLHEVTASPLRIVKTDSEIVRPVWWTAEHEKIEQMVALLQARSGKREAAISRPSLSLIEGGRNA